VSEPEAPPPKRILETTLSVGGGLAGGSTVGGMVMSGLLTHDVGMLEFGLNGDFILLRSLLSGTGVVAGIRVGDDVSFRVLAAGGLHYYSQVYDEDLAGMSGTLPYIGARWLFGYRFKVSSTARRPWLGVLGLLDYDLMREQKSVTYSPDGGFSEQTVTRELGQLTYAVQVMVGWELDLTPY
jgi:hypothetical protein